jgi:two-component system cell cycle response regulator
MINVLLIDESPEGYSDLAAIDDCTVDWAKSYDSARDMMNEKRYDICLLDHICDGELAALKAITMRGLPVVVVSSSYDDTLDTMALEKGAFMYIQKDVPIKTISQSIRYAASQSKLIRGAVFDPMTKFYRKDVFLSRLEEEIDNAISSRTELTLCMCDIDDFKVINDTYGHQTGDEVLKQFSQALSGQVRSKDIVGRYGGDEFLILLIDTPVVAATRCVQRVREAINNLTVNTEDSTIQLSATFGLVALKPGMGSRSLIKEADRALYKAKGLGKDRILME